MMSRLVFLGPPGAGKGTQAAIVSGKLNVPSIATGAIFREAIAQGSTLGKEIAQFVNSGLLVPDKLTNAIVVERLKNKDCANGFILDGYPRSLNQATSLGAHLDKKKQPLERVLYFKVDTAVVIERMGQRRICSKCGATYNLVSQPPKKTGVCDKCQGEIVARADDQPDAIRKRMQVYDENTAPLLDYYGTLRLLTILDASLPVETVAAQVAEAVQLKG